MIKKKNNLRPGVFVRLPEELLIQIISITKESDIYNQSDVIRTLLIEALKSRKMGPYFFLSTEINNQIDEICEESQNSDKNDMIRILIIEGLKSIKRKK